MDKLVNITEFGTTQQHELGFESDDQRGRQDTQIVNRLFPASQSEQAGGGQVSKAYVINRYRPGNRYKHVRLNGTVVQFDSVKYDIAFATEERRGENVIVTAASNTDSVNGIAEFGDGGPLTGDLALTSHSAGVFGFITVRGKAIANVDAAVVAGDFLAPVSTGAAGRLNALSIAAAYAQAEVQRTLAMAAGLGARALVAEPATGFKANLTWVMLT